MNDTSSIEDAYSSMISSSSSSSSCNDDVLAAGDSSISSLDVIRGIVRRVVSPVIFIARGHDYDEFASSSTTYATSSTCDGGIVHAFTLASIATTAVIPFPGGKYNLHLPDLDVIAGMTFGMALQLFIGMIFACVIYYTILVDSSSGGGSGGIDVDGHDVGAKDDGREMTKGGTMRHGRRTATTTIAKTKTTTTIKKLVIGYALATSSIISPYLIISILRIENTASRFAICSSFVLFLFRIFESMYDTVPMGARRSLKVYVAYFALPFDMLFDGNTNMPKLATWDDVRNDATRLVLDASIIVLLCSLLSPFDYMPFGSYDVHQHATTADAATTTTTSTMILGLFHWRHLGDCLVIAYFFQQGLSLSFSAFGNLIQMTLGYKCPTMMRSPIMMATSPRDFWGRRWNVLVHAVMKRGLYKPVRHYTNSSLFASLAVFVGSGAFHEWLVHACFVYGRDDNRGTTTGTVRIGSQTAFFIWNFVVIAIERYVVRSEIFATYLKRVPKSLVPPLIVMTSLPVAHWFRDPYMYGGFFRDYEQFFPMIRKSDI